MYKTVKEKMEDKLNEYKKEKYIGSFICCNCQMYNEYIVGIPVINGNDISITYKCDNCGFNNFAND